MAFEQQYRNRLNRMLKDENICKENRYFFKKFLEKEEYNLKRQNSLRTLDEPCYRTLYYYLIKFSNINKWFKNKPLKNITKKDFKKFYDDFEVGKILTAKGEPFIDKDNYYLKIFRSKPFEMLGKVKMVREVMEFHQSNRIKEVRFIEESEVRKILNIIANPLHKLLVWLAFDIGENINALLNLKKTDFTRQKDNNENIPEYRVNLRKEILKRSRKARSEITNYKETVQLLEMLLLKFQDDDLIFNFEYRNAKKFLDRAVKLTESKCKPKGEAVTWKDLRSSMACDLLKKDWTTDEVNARLGHKPSSKEIDKYVNFLALDRHKPKRKIYEGNLAKLQDEIKETKERERISNERISKLQEELFEIKKLLALKFVE